MQKAGHGGLREGHSSPGFSELFRFSSLGSFSYSDIFKGTFVPSAGRNHEEASESSADETPPAIRSCTARSGPDDEGEACHCWAQGHQESELRVPVSLNTHHGPGSPLLPWSHVATLKTAKKGNIVILA